MQNTSLDHEAQYWGDCTNTYCEETKQFVYASYMSFGCSLSDYQIDLENASVIDIGGGPCSLLLKTKNLSRGLVVDPIKYPDWTLQRYKSKGIEVAYCGGEDIKINHDSRIVLMEESNSYEKFDEVWIYNCLQHVVDPELILFNAKRCARTLRIAEWINCPSDEMHPWVLTEQNLKRWIGTSNGQTVDLNYNNCYGSLFYAAISF
jgi:2-polyprenyl-3-methyl-5-hydroxy-6-metoxy-1,4-benzoquinol methylase